MVKDGVVAAFVRVLLLLPPLACASTLSRNRPTLSTYPFLSDPARFQNLLQAKSLSWKSDDLALSRSSVELGRNLMADLQCVVWVCKPKTTKLAAHVQVTNQGNRIELQFNVRQNTSKALEYRIDYRLLECEQVKSKQTPVDLDKELECDLDRCLIYFEGDLHGTKKRILTHWENLEDVCGKIARFFDPIALADFLASIPILPLSFENIVRSSVIEDVSAEAAWQESRTSSLSDASSEETDEAEESHADESTS